MAITMATIKMTFSLDEATAKRLRQTAEVLGKPKSEVVRDAILDYSERKGRLTEAERRRLLSAFDQLVPAIPERPAADVDEEIKSNRRARQQGGRRRGEARAE